ncbi:hypothetical protein DCC85_00035 [Paenibacillus sp. CAA11]|uniref:YheC/YheD family protein n=1 Tax=Paenibacillus sp. CAA11 TaxID=1532905 RepID=UPI000D3B4AFC|nr:YheC/YheD family protein [Paenibacillus sp. CAA11]AWB42787.1 hypothetical protein DCC85_00035 [Paenibacillus sp. CAA11]
MGIQRIASKWEKTKVLLMKDDLQPYIPETQLFGLEHLQPMLDTYGLIYLKPDCGTYGQGVMNLERVPSEQDPNITVLTLRSGIQSDSFATLEEVFPVLQERIGQRPYIMQKGIRLLTYNERCFDLRVLVQKNYRNMWETTGYIGRVAALQKIVTNHHNGGSSFPVNELLKGYMDVHRMAQFITELRGLGQRVGQQLSRKYPKLKEIGLDIAVDAEFKLWILEVNTKPALFPFKWLKDKTIYKRIRRYAVRYGRLRAKRRAY